MSLEYVIIKQGISGTIYITYQLSNLRYIKIFNKKRISWNDARDLAAAVHKTIAPVSISKSAWMFHVTTGTALLPQGLDKFL